MARPAKYPEQFRRDAVELVESSGRSIAEVATADAQLLAAAQRRQFDVSKPHQLRDDA